MQQPLSKALDWFLTLDSKDSSLLSRLMFFISLGLWILTWALLRRSGFQTFLKPYVNYDSVRVFCLVVLCIRELLFGRWDRRTFVGAVLFAYLGVMAEIAGMQMLFDTVLFVFAGRNVPFRKIAVFCLAVLISILVLVIGAVLIGALPNAVVEFAADRQRYLLGFFHPNRAPIFFFFASCLWVYLRGESYKWIDAVVLLCISLALFVASDSRTSFALSAALVVFALVLKRVPDKILRNPLVGVFSVGSVALCAACGVALAAFFDPSIAWMNSLNNLLSGRLALGHQAIAQYGFTFFGQEVNTGGVNHYSYTSNKVVSNSSPGIVVDCIYIKMCVTCGVSFLILAVALVTAVNIRAFRNGQWYLLLVVGLIALHGLSEGSCAYASYDAFLFLIGGMFYTDDFAEQQGSTLWDGLLGKRHG